MRVKWYLQRWRGDKEKGWSEQWLVIKSELGYFLGGVKKGGTLSKSADNGKWRKIKEEKLGGGGIATHCCLKRRIAKSLQRRTVTTLHMATPKEDQYPHQSYFSLDYSILSLCGPAVQPTFFSLPLSSCFFLTILLFVSLTRRKERAGCPFHMGLSYMCFL